jgi:hypothetical protein
LFTIGNEFNLENFDTRKRKAMVLLNVLSVEIITPYIINQILFTVLSLKQRIDGLNILVDTANELAAADKIETSAVQNNERNIILNQRLEKNTRRWGKTNYLKDKQNQSFVNKFALKSQIFYQLLFLFSYVKTPDTFTFSLFGEDGNVLGRMVYVFGVFCECAGYSCDNTEYVHELFKLLNFTRYHSQSYVRKSSLFAASKIHKAIPSEVLYSVEFIDDLNELHLWLDLVISNDVDEECRMLAMGVISLYQSKLKELEREEETVDFGMAPLLTQVKTNYL